LPHEEIDAAAERLHLLLGVRELPVVAGMEDAQAAGYDLARH
jgi:hypothetical protein